MNREWSELNKEMQSSLKRRDTYRAGIDALLELRNRLMRTAESFREELDEVDFSAIPFINAGGYHSKTIAYSLWHIFRIEDIVAHTVLGNGQQIFFAGNYQARINSPVITTGNELAGQQIADFSRQLDLGGLYSYIFEVKESTEKIIRSMTYDGLKQKVPPARKEDVLLLNVVSAHENARWLVDYWCSKDVRGLIQMPFSRHWIMHIEASLRIKNRLCP